jgi:hypothetical protein
MQLADMFAEAYQIDIVELNRVVCEVIRIRDEGWRNATPESVHLDGFPRGPETRPNSNGRK